MTFIPTSVLCLKKTCISSQSVRVQDEDNINMASIGDVDDEQSERRPFLVANTADFGKWPPTAAADVADIPGYYEECGGYGSMARLDGHGVNPRGVQGLIHLSFFSYNI